MALTCKQIPALQMITSSSPISFVTSWMVASMAPESSAGILYARHLTPYVFSTSFASSSAGVALSTFKTRELGAASPSRFQIVGKGRGRWGGSAR